MSDLVVSIVLAALIITAAMTTVLRKNYVAMFLWVGVLIISVSYLLGKM